LRFLRAELPRILATPCDVLSPRIKKRHNVLAIALANKLARIAWSVLAHGVMCDRGRRSYTPMHIRFTPNSGQTFAPQRNVALCHSRYFALQ
jgi:hypothetical protein